MTIFLMYLWIVFIVSYATFETKRNRPLEKYEICDEKNSQCLSEYVNHFFNFQTEILLIDQQNKKYLFELCIPHKDESFYSLIEYNGQKHPSLSENINLTPKIKHDIFYLNISKIHTLFIRQKTNFNIRFKHLMKLFIQITNQAKFQMMLTLHDQSNLKFNFLLKFGYTFYEKYNFEYLEELPTKFRTLKNIKLTDHDLKIISKQNKLETKLESTLISDLVFEIEQNYDKIKTETILQFLVRYLTPLSPPGFFQSFMKYIPPTKINCEFN